MSGSVGIARDRAPLLGAEHPDSGLRRRLGRALSREPFAVLVLALDALILTALLPFVVGSDSWLALVGGREVAHDWLPHHDTLTIWPHGATWIDQQWLGQLIFYGIHAAGGFRLLLLVHVAVLLGSYALALGYAFRSGATSRSVAAARPLGEHPRVRGARRRSRRRVVGGAADPGRAPVGRAQGARRSRRARCRGGALPVRVALRPRARGLLPRHPRRPGLPRLRDRVGADGLSERLGL